ncbi:MAG: prepilin-type N-terminal cleavage/methylation domain-containing protein [Candidatus Eremiobacteraeota bacterium]|nr:prepilin-type N-terminal cleavage/methylation domain-containing protein [Candidatus Eremiobacteraeota bacterium]
MQAVPAAAIGPSAEPPQALKAAHAFRGTITYVAYRVSGEALGQQTTAPIHGEVTISGTRWSVDERSALQTLHVSSDGSWMRTDGHSLFFDDPFEVGAFANAWAPVLARLATDAPATPSGNAWLTANGVRIYAGASGDITGIVDAPSPNGVAYSLAGWIDVDGLVLPGEVLRLIAGASDAAFRITDYHVAWAAAPNAQKATEANLPATTLARTHPPASDASTAVWRRFVDLFGLLLVAIGAVAWLRRDALMERLYTRLAADPRRWRAAGSSVFVTSDGMLLFDGHCYRVGAQFYNRVTHVYTSALFLRVAAQGVTTPVVLPRRFGTPSVTKRTRTRQMRPAGNGFSLIESLVASALFSLVIVAVVFPTLIVLSQADKLAAVRENALRLAANTLVDEQAALAYGTIEDSLQTRRVGDLSVSVELKPAPLPGGAHLLAVAVADRSGRELVRLATLVGPPVPPPGSP